MYMVSLLAFSIVIFSFVLSYKQPTLKLCSDKALWILKVTFFSQMNTPFPLIHLLFLQTQSITDDINYVNIQRVLSTSSGFFFEMHLKCREDGRTWVLLHWKRENSFLCAIPARNDKFFQVIDCFYYLDCKAISRCDHMLFFLLRHWCKGILSRLLR